MNACARTATAPLLASDDPLGRLSELYAERDPLYRSIADLTVDTAGRA